MRIDAEVSEGRSLVWPLAAGAVSAALLVSLALQDTVTGTTFVTVAALLTALSFIALSRTAPRSSLAKGSRRRVGADGRGLSIDGELVLPRQSILRTRIKDESDGGHTVIIEGRGLTSSRIVHVASPRIAQALVDTLEQTPHHVEEFAVLPPWAHRMRWLTVILTASPWILLNLLRHLPGWSVLVIVGLYGLIALPIVLPQRIAIGEDGLLLRWAGQRRFVPFALLREVRATPLGVELALLPFGSHEARHDTRRVEIRLTHRADAESSKRAALLERIERGLAHHRALAPAEDEALLTRGERDLDAWIQEMSLLGSGDAHGYRALAIPRERLWAVLENPVADPSARQGAALALRARLDDEERDRLVAIAQKSASPRVRVAIDAVAQAPDSARLRVALLVEEAEIDGGDGSSRLEAVTRASLNPRETARE